MAEEIKDKETENAKAEADVKAENEAVNTEEVADTAEAENETEIEAGNGEKKKDPKDKDRKKDKDKKKSGAEAARAEAKIEELEKKLAEEKDRYARVLAEYDNYRKRTAKELDSRYQDAKADVWKGLLPVIDNFERALATEPAGGEKDAFREGIELTYKQLKEQMEKAGIKEIDAKGKEFDPELHNAVMHCEDENLGENIVADVFMKGYILGDKVLRHSMVRVAN